MTNTSPGLSTASPDPAADDARAEAARAEAADDHTEDDDEPSVLQQLASVVKEILIVLVVALTVCALVRLFVGQMFNIPSPSMESTLLVGDKVVVQKVTDFQRGDVVVFTDPGGWLRGQQGQERSPVGRVFELIGVLPDNATGHLIKRVVGMPGDKVVCCDKQGRITVNGYALDETAYLYRDADGTQVVSAVEFTVVVPKDRIFVMGDHRDESSDSRCHLSDTTPGFRKGETAFVPVDSVVGSAVAIVAPIKRAHRLHRPAIFGSVPPAPSAPDQAVIKPENIIC